jgi:hypothetical protein
MKNLFSINKTDNPDATGIDGNPYLCETVSEEVRGKLKAAFSVVEEQTAPRALTEEEKALQKKGNRYWLACLGCLAASVLLFLVGSRLGLYEAVPLLYALDIVLLIAAIVCNVKAKKISRKQTAAQNDSLRIDFSEATKRLEAAAAEAAHELGVPDTALTADVLPYHYKVKGDTILRVGKEGKFSNLAVSVFVKEEKLCFATAQELFAVPLSDVKGFREYDEDFEIDMWLKPEEFDSDRYKDFGLRKSGFLSRRGHGYFGLRISGDYEVLIPCYDWAAVKELLAVNGVS